MIDSCHIPKCSEPRTHGTPYCEAHWSLVPNKLKAAFQFTTGRFLRNIGTVREKASTADFKAITQNVHEAVQDALKERETL